MVVYRAMVLDGDKNVQLVQMQMDITKWIFFFYIKMEGVFFGGFLVWIAFYRKSSILFHYVFP
jgi:hypothetical protein